MNQEQGVVYVWGNTDYGQLGLGFNNNNNNIDSNGEYYTTPHTMNVSLTNAITKFPVTTNPSTDRLLPVPLNSLKPIRFSYVAAGLRHSAAITGTLQQ
jgi:alpha-tubulin suppressor-like RCC1 family protein